ncbi:MAG: oligopeptide:H+ symporter [Legionella sp.]
MPEGVFSLCAIQIVSTLSFSVLYSTLVLFMESNLGVPVSTAHSIMGVFVAFNYALHLLGGFWGGRFISNRALFCLGMVLQVIGCILLSFSTVNFLYYGLAVYLTGSGLNVTCLNCMLTQRFAPDDPRRETAFLINYAGMNVGFFIGFSMSGIFQLTQSYERLFLISSLGNLCALILCLCCWRQLADRGTLFSQKNKIEQKKANRVGLLLILVLPFILSVLLHNADWAKKLVLITGAVMIVFALYLAKQQPTKLAQNKLFAFVIFMTIGIIFFMLYHVAPMGLTMFVNYNVQREYAQWIIPPQWFQNINTVCIAFGGPLLGILMNRLRQQGLQINIPTQFALSLLCIGVGFVILPVGIVYANHAGLVNSTWIVVSYILQSAGELLISPIGYGMIGYLAPSYLQGTIMGMWMLTSGVGGALASYSSSWMIVGQDSVSPLATNRGYSHVFLLLGLFAIASSIVAFILVPRLRMLTREDTNQIEMSKSMVVCE